jgi:hypothetical protein
MGNRKDKYHQFYTDSETGLIYPGVVNAHLAPNVKRVPPPKPKGPVGDELLQSYATTHRVRPVWRGIRFASREHLMIGLDYLGGRLTEQALSETLRQIGDMDSSGLAVPMMLMAQPNADKWYERTIRNPICALEIDDESIAKGTKMFKDGWDYDGPGVWHKASLEVWVDASGWYLHYWAAYVGNAPEKRVAEALGAIATLNILRYNHRLTYETHDDRFAIPLDDLRIIYTKMFRKLDSSLFITELTTPSNPEEKSGKWADVVGPVVITAPKNPVNAVVRLGYNTLWASAHDRDPVTNNPLEHHAYRIEGDYLTGPAKEREEAFADDWRRAIDLELDININDPMNQASQIAAKTTSDLITKELQTHLSRPDPYPTSKI